MKKLNKLKPKTNDKKELKIDSLKEDEWLKAYEELVEAVVEFGSAIEEAYLYLVSPLDRIREVKIVSFEKIKNHLENRKDYVKKRLEYLKSQSFDSVDKRNADNTTIRMNEDTKIIVSIYENLDNDTLYLYKATNEQEKIIIKTKIEEYFFIIEEIDSIIERVLKDIDHVKVLLHTNRGFP